MSFSSYLQDYLVQRLSEERGLMVFDPHRRYREICDALASRGVTVLDACGPTTESRDQIARAWLQIPHDGSLQLLVYRDRAAAVDEERLLDPLSSFSELMGVFPRPGAAHENYRSLAVQAYPEFTEEVESLFAHGEPAVSVLDALGSGRTFPVLADITGFSSPRDIVIALLDSRTDLFMRVSASPAAAAELDALVSSVLGIPSGTASTPDALWRILLFSEFALARGESLPPAYRQVPHAPPSRAQAISRLNDRLRRDLVHDYLDRAETIAEELGLAALNDGDLEAEPAATFRFQNVQTLRRAVEAVSAGDPEAAAALVGAGRATIWAEHDALLSAAWYVVQQARDMIEALAAAPADEIGQDPVGWYRRRGLCVDRAYRALVFSHGRLPDEEPYGVDLTALLESLSNAYRVWIGRVQSALIGEVRRAGWPPDGTIRQDRIFERVVEPLLAEGKRVAYFLVDALRYELADSLAEKLKAGRTVSLEVGAALIPTKTPLGMAALGPENRAKLAVRIDGGGWKVFRGDQALATAADRDAWFLRYKGDQCVAETLAKWHKRKKGSPLPDTVSLAVIRSTEIDSAGENADALLRSSLENLMNELAVGVRKSFDLGFDAVVVTADHGFLYLPQRVAGDHVTLPPGNAVVRHDRFAFGSFEPAEQVLMLSGSQLGYEVNAESVIVPVSPGVFAHPGSYTHGGLSLQEALIPILTVQAAPAQRARAVAVSLRYRDRKEARVTSLNPAVTIAVGGEGKELDFDESWAGQRVEIQIVVVADDNTTEVGRVGPNEFLDTDTGQLRIRTGTTTTIPIVLDEEHRGRCTVRALNPNTQVEYDSITLDVSILDFGMES